MYFYFELFWNVEVKMYLYIYYGICILECTLKNILNCRFQNNFLNPKIHYTMHNL